ncbi:MAG: hypothetical protein NC120_06745 [Ruminococcus sp.]|nr:hypothetical protein [Ruminococcus sp.]
MSTARNFAKRSKRARIDFLFCCTLSDFKYHQFINVNKKSVLFIKMIQSFSSFRTFNILAVNIAFDFIYGKGFGKFKYFTQKQRTVPVILIMFVNSHINDFEVTVFYFARGFSYASLRNITVLSQQIFFEKHFGNSVKAVITYCNSYTYKTLTMLSNT